MKKLLTRLLAALGWKLLRQADWKKIQRRIDLYQQLLRWQAGGGSASPAAENATASVVFSKDRAMQLHALLSSYRTQVTHPGPIYILYRASDAEHHAAYQEVFALHQDLPVHPWVERNFRQDLLNILREITARMTMFLTDDDIFLAPCDLRDFGAVDAARVVPSLRMGANLESSYAVGAAVQPLPPFGPTPRGAQDRLSWQWQTGEHDWNYPLSVDGHLYATAELRMLAGGLEFHSPNTFESELQWFRPFFEVRQGLSYSTSRIVNVPHNRVQNEYANFYSGAHQNDLLRQWQLGYEIDVSRLAGLVNRSVHEEIGFHFILRTGPSVHASATP